MKEFENAIIAVLAFISALFMCWDRKYRMARHRTLRWLLLHGDPENRKWAAGEWAMHRRILFDSFQ